LSQFIINGGNRLSGEVEISGAKNAHGEPFYILFFRGFKIAFLEFSHTQNINSHFLQVVNASYRIPIRHFYRDIDTRYNSFLLHFIRSRYIG
jgi:hypothetical protein